MSCRYCPEGILPRLPKRRWAAPFLKYRCRMAKSPSAAIPFLSSILDPTLSFFIIHPEFDFILFSTFHSFTLPRFCFSILLLLYAFTFPLFCSFPSPLFCPFSSPLFCSFAFSFFCFFSLLLPAAVPQISWHAPDPLRLDGTGLRQNSAASACARLPA